MKPLILTILTNYTYRKVEPFFRTLRKTGYLGDVVVFYDKIDRETLSHIRKWNVNLVKFDSTKYLKKDIRIVHYRFNLFYDFLKKNISNYDKVFICDVRDIVFQKDPFNYSNYSKINFFCENEPINKSNINSYILIEAGGKEALKKYGNNLVSCAGTTLGDSKYILNYLKFMSDNIKSGFPIDQGQHNLYFYSSKVHNSKRFCNLSGPILTISNLGNEMIKFNSKMEVTNKDGSVINIIHQYDRNNKLLWKFNSLKNYFLNLIDYKYISFKRFIKKILFKIPLLKKFFKKKYYSPSEFE